MGGDSTVVNSYQKAWEHFLDVLELSAEQRKALKGQRLSGVDKFLRDGGKDEFFDFDTENMFPTRFRDDMRDAWEWLDMYAAEIAKDDDNSWFLQHFQQSYRMQVIARKREAEDKLQNERQKRYKIVEPHQASASTFTGTGSRTMEGIASLPPVYYEHLIPKQVKDMFTSKFETPANAAESEVIENLVSEFLNCETSYKLKEIPETSKDSSKQQVQVHHLDFIAKQFHGQVATEREHEDGLSKGTRHTLRDIGLFGGVATPSSFPEAYFHTKKLDLPSLSVEFVTTSILECKGTTSSPVEGHGEGIANATNAAMTMLRVGIPASKVVVPVFSTTGSVVQVAAVYLLDSKHPERPCLPAVCFVTPLLRMSVEEEREKAAKILVAMERLNKQMELYVQSNTLEAPTCVEMGLDPNKFHLKLMTDFFSVCAFKESSLRHLLHVTSHLAGTAYACLPLAVRLKDDRCNCDAIVFENLVDYRIGLPIAMDDRKALVFSMKEAVDDMHKRGVIHMDLYLSNIMWTKKGNDSFSVKIIDFDAAHALGSKLTQATWTRMLESKVGFAYLGNRASTDHDDLYMKMLDENMDDPRLFVAGPNESKKQAKERLDSACTSLIAGIFDSIDLNALRGNAE